VGLPRSAVHLLIREAVARPFGGTVATLGRQHVYATAAEVQSLAGQHALRLGSQPARLHREPSLAAEGFVSDDWLYEAIGFRSSVRIDLSDYEQAEVSLDLNDSATPPNLQQQFDVVLDSGTIEHVFRVPQALDHCVRMVRPGGRVIHLTPASNSMDHGLYSLSPCLLATYYQLAGFSIESIWLCRMPRDFLRRSWRLYQYPLPPRGFLPLGRLGSGAWFTWLVARAGESPSPPTSVLQGAYEATWDEAARQSTIAGSSLTGSSLAGSSLTGSSLTGSSLTGSSLTGSSLTGSSMASPTTGADGMAWGEPAGSRAAALLRWTRRIPMATAAARRLIRWRRRWVNERFPFAYAGKV
jgi:SAM-dependent methyltransferase